jgi:hypothetical protein
MTTPNPNEQIQLNLQAISTLCGYPVASIRKDFSQGEWLDYKENWDLFNKVWIYNYSISTLNGERGTSKLPWMYTSNRERSMYLKGQSAHVETYPEAGSAGQFNNIPR